MTAKALAALISARLGEASEIDTVDAWPRGLMIAARDGSSFLLELRAVQESPTRVRRGSGKSAKRKVRVRTFKVTGDGELTRS